MSILALPILATLVVAGPAASQPRLSTKHVYLDHCLVSVSEEVQVPARETGPLTELAVKDGDVIQRGQLLARIDDREAQLQKLAATLQGDAAVARAADDIEVRYAEASLSVADAELTQNLEINRRSPGSVPESEIRRLRLTKRRAELQIEKSRLDLKVAKLESRVQQAAVKSAEANIERRQIVSPLDGVVVGLARRQGEWVNAGDPVVRLVRMDTLRVEGFLTAQQYNPADVDRRPVTVEVELARGRRAQFQGSITYVSPLVHAGGKYRVRAEVENRTEQGHWMLRPGAEAAMTIHLK